jgi:hypothetical protein
MPEEGKCIRNFERERYEKRSIGRSKSRWGDNISGSKKTGLD